MMVTPVSEASLKQSVLAYVRRLGTHQAVHSLIRVMARDLSASPRNIRKALNSLVAEGLLDFTSRLGTSFVEPGFQRPVRLSHRIWMARPDQTPAIGQDEIVIYIASGAAFGDGRHPTTRLALKGVEKALAFGWGEKISGGTRCLDVGTGSGILALAALGLGMDDAWGVDHDACARSEARANARCNRLTDRLQISAELPPKELGTYHLITANLRLPTLCQLAPVWTAYRRPGSRLVISGIREAETESLLASYTVQGWSCIDSAVEDGWAMVLFTS